jgi:hypothetical protein
MMCELQVRAIEVVLQTNRLLHRRRCEPLPRCRTALEGMSTSTRGVCCSKIKFEIIITIRMMTHVIDSPRGDRTGVCPCGSCGFCKGFLGWLIINGTTANNMPFRRHTNQGFVGCLERYGAQQSHTAAHFFAPPRLPVRTIFHLALFLFNRDKTLTDTGNRSPVIVRSQSLSKLDFNFPG